MKVLFDVSSLLTKYLTAEGLYSKNLFRSLKGLGADIEPVYKVPSGVKENYIEQHIGHSPKKFYSLLSPKGAVLHGPSVNLLSESPKFKKVISLNDMSMFRDAMMDSSLASQLQAHLKEQLQCDPLAVIVPTYEVHNEFLVRYPKYVNRVHVISPGCDHILDSSNVGDHRISDNPYFVFVGVIDKRSNVAGLIKAFHGFSQLQDNINLVLVGGNGYGHEAIHKLIESASCRNRIKIVGQKSTAQLKKIYSDAVATIIPSFYEGFSYPLVESMKMGCPVITSAIGAMEEVGREAAHLVNPKDPEQIMAAMERIVLDKPYKQKLIEAGSELTQSLTWLKCAREILSLYEKC